MIFFPVSGLLLHWLMDMRRHVVALQTCCCALWLTQPFILYLSLVD